MQIEFSKRHNDRGVLYVYPDEGERYYSETAFYYSLKNKLISMGYDVIKKLMYKDGHWVDEYQYYIRSRKKSVDSDSLMVVYPLHNVYLIHREFNEIESGEQAVDCLVLDVYYNIFKKGGE